MPKPTVVELSCLPDEDEPDGPLWWAAEWGLEGESVGHEHSTDDLQEIINAVVDDARDWAARGHQPVIHWHTRTSDDVDIDDALDALGLELPTAPD